ncbi:hypothetical protein GUJ93_ZPchr0009g2403 [Zizania palustris]|uniref:Uncharacterized protein n=1 Tax=Zizania palustris TaxID=103762 RepID=A0A8J5S4V8_ZIZPA|nr:hypothetical protein GUJ93_ZPchr0009g2403 [Zizania palustris]
MQTVEQVGADLGGSCFGSKNKLKKGIKRASAAPRPAHSHGGGASPNLGRLVRSGQLPSHLSQLKLGLLDLMQMSSVTWIL